MMKSWLLCTGLVALGACQTPLDVGTNRDAGVRGSGAVSSLRLDATPGIVQSTSPVELPPPSSAGPDAGGGSPSAHPTDAPSQPPIPGPDAPLAMAVDADQAPQGIDAQTVNRSRIDGGSAEVQRDTKPTVVLDGGNASEVDPCAVEERMRGALVAEWRFDEGEGKVAGDSSGRGHDGAVMGASWASDGVLGRALHFDGHSYVEVPWNRDLDIDGAITLVAWIRPSTLDDLALTILSKAVSSTTGYDMGLHTYDVLFGRVGGADGAGRTLAKNGGTALGQWQQVVVTYDGEYGSLYYNGALASRRAIGGGNGVVQVDLTIGKPADRDDLYFKGDIDEVRVLASALDTADVAALYGCVASRSSFPLPPIVEPPPTVPPTGVPGPIPDVPIASDGLVAYFPFSMSGEDASGHGNHAQVEGPLPTSDRFGNANAAYVFDGVDDQVLRERPVDLPAGTSPRTIAGWFRADKAQVYAAALFGYGAARGQASFQLTIGPASMSGFPSVFRVNGWGDSADWRTNVDPALALDGAWHHAAVSYDGKQVVFYLDGVKQASASWTYRTQPASITIGAETETGGWAFTGAIDDVMIFSRVLSGTEVAKLAAN
jgi:hypothetical protein